MVRRRLLAVLLALAACGREAPPTPVSEGASRAVAPPAPETPRPRRGGFAEPDAVEPPASDAPEGIAAWIDVLRDRTQTTEDKNAAAKELAAPGAVALPQVAAMLDEPDHADWALETLILMGPDAAPAAPKVAALLAEDDGTAFVAQAALIAIGEKAWPDLIAALSHGRRSARVRAAEAFKRMDAQDDAVAAALVARVGDAAMEVRKAAVHALGAQDRLRDGVLPALVGALADDAEGVRRAAAVALGSFRADAAPAVNALSGAMDDPDAGVRMAAMRTLGEIGVAAASTVPRMLDAARRDPALAWSAVSAAASIAPDSVPPLLQDDRPAIRAAVARCFLEEDEPAAVVVAALPGLLDDADAEVRASAMRALRKRPLSVEVVPKLRALLRSLLWEERCLAALMLDDENARTPETVEALVAAGHDAEIRVRRYALLTLGRLGAAPEIAAPALAAALADPEPDVSGTAATALLNFAAAAAIVTPELRRAVTTGSDGWTRLRAAQALAAIERPCPDAVAAATGLLVAENSSVRAEAVRFLAAEAGAAAIPDIVERLEDADAQVRVAAADVLGGFGPAARSASEALTKAARSRNAQVADAAKRALEKIGAE